MSKEKKLEKIRVGNYEILCMMRDCTSEEKDSLMEKVKKSTSLENFTVKSETKTLAYPVREMKTAEYLLLGFRIDRERLSEVEEILKSPLVIRHMTVNLDTEKKIRIKSSGKSQRNKKFMKSGFKGDKFPQEKPNRKATQGDGNQSKVNN